MTIIAQKTKNMQPGEFLSEVSPQILQGLSYSRAVGYAAGIFLLFWGPLSFMRLPHTHNILFKIESVILFTYGFLLVLPWSRIRSVKAWKRLFYLSIILAIAFTFALVLDATYIHLLIAETGDKATAVY